jgi:hypothetical protein
VRKIFDLAGRSKAYLISALENPTLIFRRIKKGYQWIRAASTNIPSAAFLNRKKSSTICGKGIICEDAIITAGVTGGLLLPSWSP